MTTEKTVSDFKRARDQALYTFYVESRERPDDREIKRFTEGFTEGWRACVQNFLDISAARVKEGK